jgi:hypothetical protein
LYSSTYLVRTRFAPCGDTEDGFCDPAFWTQEHVTDFVPRSGYSVDAFPLTTP